MSAASNQLSSAPISIDYDKYRAAPDEQTRVANLLSLVPQCNTLIDVGSRDGYISARIAERGIRTLALDICAREFQHAGVAKLQADVQNLPFADGSVDVILCACVMEHLPWSVLATGCHEMARVSRRGVLVGVPYKQDTRLGRTTCSRCGTVNPPWGHVNVFDERSLAALFPGLLPAATRYVWKQKSRTSRLAAALMNAAGNPWGTYAQEEPCVNCGSAIVPPGRRTLVQRALAATALGMDYIQQRFTREWPAYIHVYFEKQL